MRSARRHGDCLRRSGLEAEDVVESDDDDGPFSSKNYDSDFSAACMSTSRSGRKKAPVHLSRPLIVTATKNSVTFNLKSKANESQASMPQQKNRVRAVTPNEMDLSENVTDDDASDTDVVEVLWDPAEDPWGHDGFKEGDVIISSGRSTGLGHIETLLPSLRFELDPFVNSKLYCTTHCTPIEGFQVLELRRDPHATLDWGFTVERHEFGGACLFNTVDPASPASSAVSYEIVLPVAALILSQPCLFVSIFRCT
jgi:hypothetical protein